MVLQEMNHWYKKGTRNALCHVNQTRFISNATNVAIGIRKGSCGTSEYEEEVESIAIVDTLRSLALALC